MAATAQLISFGPYWRNGVLQQNIQVLHYEPGTSTDKAVWRDRAKTIEAAQPVVGGANGRVLFYADGLYKFVVQDSNGIDLEIQDNADVLTQSSLDAIEDISADVAALRTTKDPGEVGTESLPENAAEEIQTLRHMVRELSGEDQWHETPPFSINALSNRFQQDTDNPSNTVLKLPNSAPSVLAVGDIFYTDTGQMYAVKNATGVPTAIVVGDFEQGNVIALRNTTAPLGWVRDTTSTDGTALRFTTGTPSSGGTKDVKSWTQDPGQLAGHEHFVVNNNIDSPNTPNSSNHLNNRSGNSPASGDFAYQLVADGNEPVSGKTSTTGNGDAIEMKYQDVIFVTKDTI